MAQTAVEWLALKYYHGERFLNEMDIAEAIAMEKHQRITDYNIGYQDAQCNHINDAENYIYESSSRV